MSESAASVIPISSSWSVLCHNSPPPQCTASYQHDDDGCYGDDDEDWDDDDGDDNDENDD